MSADQTNSAARAICITAAIFVLFAVAAAVVVLVHRHHEAAIRDRYEGPANYYCTGIGLPQGTVYDECVDGQIKQLHDELG